MLRVSRARHSGQIAPKAVKVPFGQHQFIVVGGGAAGTLIAARLAQENFNTLLIEAGPDTAKTPFNLPISMGKWRRESPAAHILNRHDGKFVKRTTAYVGDTEVSLETPKVVGGAGVVLGPRTYVRGHAYDWAGPERFPLEFEDAGLILYYKKLEVIEGAHMHRGTMGRFFITKGRTVSQCYMPALDGLRKADVGLLNEFNGPYGFRESGAGRAEALVDSMTGFACSSVNQYVKYCRDMKRPLTIRGDTTVDHVKINNNAATGVVIKDANGVEEELVASKGVIVCGGALGTSQILQRSDVPQHVRAALESPCFWTVPCDTLRFATAEDLGVAGLAHPAVRFLAQFEWAVRKDGWLAGSYDDMVAYIETSVSRNRRGPLEDKSIRAYPDVKITLQPFMTEPNGRIIPEFGLQFKVQLIRPQARGTVGLDGVPRLPANEADEAALEEAKQMVRKAAENLQASGSLLRKGGEMEVFRTYEGPHGGTAGLGVAIDKDSFKVNGVEGLWVCDGSAIPKPMVAEAVPLAYALGEKCVDSVARRAPPVL